MKWVSGRAWSNDPDYTAENWPVDDAFNIGVACGPSNLVVIDVDVKCSLATALKLLPAELPDTMVVRTGRGKWHFYLERTGDYDWFSHRIAGTDIDIKTVGGLVVGPGSVYEGGTYEIVWDDEVADITPELAEWATARPPRRRVKYRKRGRPTRWSARNQREGIVGWLMKAPHGERNHRLYGAARMAGGMIADGTWDEGDAEPVLEHAARQIGLDDFEIGGTIDSGFRAALLEGDQS